MAATGLTAYIRFRLKRVTGEQHVFSIGVDPAAPGALSAVLSGTTLTISLPSVALLNRRTVTVAIDTYYLISIVVDSTLPDPADHLKVWINGSPATATISQGVTLITMARLFVSSLNDVDKLLQGRGYEYWFFSTAHDDTKRQAIQAYINWLYA